MYLNYSIQRLTLVLLSFLLSGVASANDGVILSLNEGSGTTALDVRGVADNGALVGNPDYDSDTGDGSTFSLRLDGIDDLIDLGPLEIAGSQLTLAAWFKINQFPNTIRDSRIISKASGLSAREHVFMLGTIKSGNATRLRGRVRISGSTKTVTAVSGNLSLGNWHHGAMTYDGTTLRLYVDGVEVGSSGFSGQLEPGPGIGVAVGAQPGGGRQLDGSVDDVHILPSALGAEEIAAIASGLQPIIANDDNYEVAQNGVLSVSTATGLLSNDSVPPGVDLQLVDEADHGLLTLNPDYSFTYVPDADFLGSDNFSYQVSDGTKISNVATVSISIIVVRSSFQLYLGSTTDGSVTTGGESIDFRDEDILLYDAATQNWSMHFDGSDVGITGDINAFSITNDGAMLFSLTAPLNISGVGLVDDSDIVRFIPQSFGETTAGTFEMYLDGSDVGLTGSGETIHALSVMDNGDLLISTNGNVTVPGLSASDEDLLRFTPDQLGANTTGSWSVFFDGSDVEMLSAGEDIRAAFIDDGKLYLATAGDFSSNATNGTREDVFVCLLGTLDDTTNCDFSVLWRGSEFGFSTEAIDSLAVIYSEPGSDEIAPVASPIFSPEASAFNWYGSDVTVNFNWSDNPGGSGLDTNACSTTQLITGEGANVGYSATCSDLAGNGGSITGNLSIDRLAPETNLVATPPLENAATSATFEFTGADALAGIDTLECQLDDAPLATCDSPKVFTGLSAGVHTFSVVATDLAGNRDDSSADFIWSVGGALVDTTPPVANVVLTPNDNFFNWYDTDVTVTFNWVDNSDGSGIDPGNCTASLFVTSEGEGVSYSGSCTDLAGNSGNAIGTLAIDKSGPETFFATTPPDSQESGGASFEFGGSDSLSGVSGFECQLDGMAFIGCTSPKVYSGLGVGTHTVAVRAVDIAENRDLTPVVHSWEVTSSEPPDLELRAKASRFVQMASLGATNTDIDTVLNDGTESWLDSQLAIVESGSRFDWMVANGYAAPSNRQTNKGFNNAIWRRLFTAQNSVAQRWALALSEIFVINPFFIAGSGGWEAFAGAAYMDMLEIKGLGSYRKLLEEVTLSHQMGAYLSLRGSKRADGTGRAPDENYAREILQLFSIGLYELNDDGTVKLDADGKPIETYTNDDIEGLAAAFTGWGNNFTSEQSVASPDHHRRRMIMQPEFHENGEVGFLGTTIPAGTNGEQAMELALDRISNHANVGPFLGKQLIQRLVTSNPTAAYVSRVASVFNQDENGERGNLSAVLKAVLLDPEAQGASPIVDHQRGKLREPMLRFIQWGRMFNLNDPTDTWYVPDLSKSTSQLGQSPLRSPSVFNFFRPGYIPPNTQLGDLGLAAPELQIAGETSVVGYVNFLTRKIENGWSTVKPDYSNELSLATTPSLLVDRLNMLLTANQLEQETYDLIVSAVTSMPASNDQALLRRVLAAVLMVMVSPDYLVLK